MSTTSTCKYKEIRQFEFVAKTIYCLKKRVFCKILDKFLTCCSYRVSSNRVSKTVPINSNLIPSLVSKTVSKNFHL